MRLHIYIHYILEPGVGFIWHILSKLSELYTKAFVVYHKEFIIQKQPQIVI